MTTTKNLTPATEERLCHWLGQACPGDRLIYHRGPLLIDLKSGGVELTRIIRRAGWAAERGLALLATLPAGAGEFLHTLTALPKSPVDPAPGLALLRLIERGLVATANEPMVWSWGRCHGGG